MEKIKVLVYLIQRNRVMHASDDCYFDYKEITNYDFASLEKAIEELSNQHHPRGYEEELAVIAEALLKGESYASFMLCDALKFDSKIFVDTEVFTLLEYYF